MAEDRPRIARERRTIDVMIRLYCRDQHRTPEGLCQECSDLLNYANAKLDRCPFQERKTTCAKCSVHCYSGDMRTKVRLVMRYSGPRMLYHHPALAILHLLDGGRKDVVR